MKMSRILSFLISAIVISDCSAQSFSVMTFNIRYDEPTDKENAWPARKDDVVSMLRDFKPAFLGIQEALAEQVTYIDSSLTSHAYVGVGRDDGMTSGEYTPLFYDNTVFSCLEHNTIWLSETPEKPSKGWDSQYYRICTYGIFEHKTSQRKLLVLNTHLDHQAPLARKNSAQLILQKIAELNNGKDYPVVLIGDFNATPNEEPVRILTQQLQDAFRVSRVPWHGIQGTFNGFESNAPLHRRIDYIFVNDLYVVDYLPILDKTSTGLWLSDHIPVLTELSFWSEE